jgi:hypothetical protein
MPPRKAEGLVKSWFEELDCRDTPLGELILQRRRVAALGGAEAYEVKLNGEYLSPACFTRRKSDWRI